MVKENRVLYSVFQSWARTVPPESSPPSMRRSSQGLAELAALQQIPNLQQIPAAKGRK